ncbi:hypothetical protein M2H12_14995 [Vibrio vulnificus]|nr:hypothetical protein [Vibrio vulnificus]MCU8167007.1 hypothetical protein [Vibrio vulnificus]MCU8171446.1 hypothetical protein [Vibrio vulnificus]MCU8266218.1 hypothetical protein [Vibrio vulnificus]
MSHKNSIIDIYNGLIQKYQFDQLCLTENRTPIRTAYFLSEKARESVTLKLDMLAHFAHDLGEPELAGDILNAAADLGGNAAMPKPM